MFQPSDLPIEAFRPSSPPTGFFARAVADQLVRSLSDYWNGGADLMEFERWLAAFWQPELTARPERVADAVSPHGAGGRGIDWYETSASVVGHVAGIAGGYCIPLGSVRQALSRFELEAEQRDATAREPVEIVDAHLVCSMSGR